MIDFANQSLAEQVALLEPEERDEVLSGIDPISLQYDWNFWGRPKQFEPAWNDQSDDGKWFGWLNLAGRGYGKTRVGAEWVRDRVDTFWDSPIRIAGIAETKADARDVLVEGDSGILSVCHPDRKPKYEPSKRRVTWSNGSQLFLFSGDEPNQLRGPQFHFAWVDELAKYQYPQEAWDMLEFGLRLGDHPQVCITTTPRPIPIITQLIKDPDFVITTGSSYENYGNLAPRFIKRVLKKYEGTRLGRQELHAEILGDAPGALWTRDILEDSRRKELPQDVWLVSVVVAIDPAVTSGETADETGICVAGLGSDGHGYVLRDLSKVFSPRGWARRGIAAYEKYKADRLVAEANNGGDLVEVNIRTIDVKKKIAFRKVHASRGKAIRAAPVASLFEQNRCHIIGAMPQMEDQLVAFTPEGYIGGRKKTASKKASSVGDSVGGNSPDRAEAMIWAIYYLMLRRARKPGTADRWPTYKR